MSSQGNGREIRGHCPFCYQRTFSRAPQLQLAELGKLLLHECDRRLGKTRGGRDVQQGDKKMSEILWIDGW